MGEVQAFFDAMIARCFPPPSDLALLAPHQRAAAARLLAILERYGGAMLADEVGVGKSYVAAAVAKAAVARGEEVELFVPASLVSQWAELQRRFGLELAIRSHDSLLRADVMPRPGGLVIVDEAHRFRNPATRRYRCLALRSIARRVLLVTATPVCNRASDLEALLRLIAADDALRLRGVESIAQAFCAGHVEEVKIALEELVVRRDRRALSPLLQFGSLQREVVTFPASTDALRRSLERLRFPLIAASRDLALLRGLLARRLESSRAALLDTLRRQRRFYCRARESIRQGRSLSKRDYRRIFGDDEEGSWFQDLLFRDLWPGSAATDSGSAAAVDAEIEALDCCVAAAEAMDERKPLLLGELVARSSGPLLVYTSAVATARDLHRLLGGRHRVGLVTSRDAFVGRLRASCPEAIFGSLRELDVVVTTDLGAEGLNLQEASAVIHYDLPWNPVRLDQRNGRAHRIGQRRESVRAIHFVPERRDERIVARAIAAKRRVRRSLLDDESGLLRSEMIDRAILRMPPFPAGSALIVPSREDFSACLVTFGGHAMFIATLAGRFVRSEAELFDLVRAIDGEGRIVPAEEVLREHRVRVERLLRSRILVPPIVDTAESQKVLETAQRLGTEEASDVFRVPYRAGASFLIRDVAREYLDVTKILELEALLRAERPPDPSPAAAVVIEAAIVGRRVYPGVAAHVESIWSEAISDERRFYCAPTSIEPPPSFGMAC